MKKSISNSKNSNIITCLILYMFLLILPFFILSLTTIPLQIGINIIKILAFIYNFMCCLITIFTYKNFKKLDSKIAINREKLLRKGLLVLFIFFFSIIFKSVPLLLLSENISSIPLNIRTIYSTIFEIVEVGLVIYILKEQVTATIKDIKINKKEYFSRCLKYYIITKLIMYASNLIINSINSGNIAVNEQAIRDSFKIAPIYIYFSSVLIAPILEELVFRQGIRNIFKNKYLFIIISGLAFGLLHIIGNVNTPIDLLYLIPYSIPGISFAYMLYKTDNVIVPMGFHLLNNAITMTVQLLLITFVI